MQTLPVREKEVSKFAATGESAKDIVIKPVHASIAREMVRAGHYSHKVVANSSLHLGAFWKGKLEGVMQFGAPIDRRKSLTLVADTGWNEFLELNRMWFSPTLPKNSESRALSVAMKLIRKNLPQIKWVISYADGTQAGSGTIYRAAGFVLTGYRKNQTIFYVPAMKECFAKLTFTTLKNYGTFARIKRAMGVDVLAEMKGGASIDRVITALKAEILEGYQVRYIYFVRPEWRNKLKVPEVPYSELKKLQWPEGIK